SRNRRANPAGTATVVGRSSAPFADEALQLAYRAGVSVLDSPLYPGQRQAASARDGRRGSGTLPQRPGAQGAGGAQYPEPGAVGAAVPVSRGAGAGTAVDGERGTGQARAALAGGAVARGNDGFAAPSVRTRGVDGGAAVRQRPAIDGVPAPAGQGRGRDRYERHAKFHRASPQARDAGALRVAGYPVPHPCNRAEAGLTRQWGSSAGRDAARPATA